VKETLTAEPQRKPWLDAWHVNPSANKTYDFIDGLRGVAILLVIGCHFLYYNPEARASTRFVGEVFSAGARGVTLFFTLSGFLISWPFWKRKVKGATNLVPPGYGWRRFWKIYPPLGISIVLLTPMCFFWMHDPGIWKAALQWLAGWPIVRPISGNLNPVMWSLVVEVQFYLLLPVLFLAVKRLQNRTALWLLFSVFLIIPTAVRLLETHYGIYATLHPNINLHFPTFLDAFAFGVLAAGLDNMGMIKRGWARLGDWGVMLIGFSLILSAWLKVYVGMDEPTRSEISNALVKVGAGLALCYVANPDYPSARMLSSSWLRWCGIISYEWYLFHQPLALWTRSTFGPASGNPVKYVLIVACPLLVSLLIAAIAYRLFSLPILRRGRERNRAEAVATRLAVR
jgi:peptidoglycan/LPS O-acetylase OafA/YrhL